MQGFQSVPNSVFQCPCCKAILIISASSQSIPPAFAPKPRKSPNPRQKRKKSPEAEPEPGPEPEVEPPPKVEIADPSFEACNWADKLRQMQQSGKLPTENYVLDTYYEEEGDTKELVRKHKAKIYGIEGESRNIMSEAAKSAAYKMFAHRKMLHEAMAFDK